MVPTPADAPQHFDLVVLGAGSGGYTAAVRAAQLGQRVAVVEERFWGGVCLNIGCIPTKSLLRNAEVAHLIRDKAATFGIASTAPITIDYEAAYTRSRKVVDGRVRGVNFLMRKNAITQVNGHGEFLDDRTLHVTTADPSERSESQEGTRTAVATLTFENCIIDVGATTRLLPWTTRSERVVTYEEVVTSTAVPRDIVIIGAGAIGVEFAHLLNSFGTEVTLIEYADRVLPLEDRETSAELERRFKRAGIRVLTNTAVTGVHDNGPQAGTASVTFRTRTDDSDDRDSPDSPDRSGTARDNEPSEDEITTQRVLQAIGFAPRVTGYGLEHTGVKLTATGAIAVDDACRTNVPHIYAIGDVTAKLMLAHVADAMGIIAAESIAGLSPMPLDYVMVPRVTFSQPQVASFGLTEDQAREAGFEVKVAKFPFTANGKAPGIDETAGFVKLVADQTYGELVGAHLVGADVAELLPELTLAQLWDLTAAEVARNIHAHPTLSEAVKEALHGISGHMINL